MKSEPVLQFGDGRELGRLPVVLLFAVVIVTAVATFIPSDDDYVIWQPETIGSDALYFWLPAKVFVHTVGLALLVALHLSVRETVWRQREAWVRLAVAAVPLAVFGFLFRYVVVGLGISLYMNGFRNDFDRECTGGIMCNPGLASFWATPLIALALDALTTVIVQRWKPRFWSVYWTVASIIFQAVAASLLLTRMASS